MSPTDLASVHRRINILLDQTNATKPVRAADDYTLAAVAERMLLRERAKAFQEALACFSPDPPEKAG